MERPPNNLRWEDIEQISFERLSISATCRDEKNPKRYEFSSIEEMVEFYERWN